MAEYFASKAFVVELQYCYQLILCVLLCILGLLSVVPPSFSAILLP